MSDINKEQHIGYIRERINRGNHKSDSTHKDYLGGAIQN